MYLIFFMKISEIIRVDKGFDLPSYGDCPLI